MPPNLFDGVDSARSTAARRLLAVRIRFERNHEWIDRWKVLLPKASGDGHGREGRLVTCLGEPIALAPGSACTQTYFVAGVFDTREETENYAHYLATKFVRFLVLQRKVDARCPPDRFRFVPHARYDAAAGLTPICTHTSADRRTRSTTSRRPSTLARVNLSLDSPIPASHLPGGAKYRPPGNRAAAETDGEDDE